MSTRRCASRGPSAARGATARIRSRSGSRARRRPRGLGHGLEQFFASARQGRATRGRRAGHHRDQLRELPPRRARARGGRADPLRAAGRARRDPVRPRCRRRSPQERARPVVVDAVCAQCHSGPSPRLADGTALRNSSEALDLAASPCTSATCTDCHDPHRADARGDEARSLAACTHCHAALADAATARAHAGTRSRARDLPRLPHAEIVMGIDRFVRTHRISSPIDERARRGRRAERVQPVPPRSLDRVDDRARCSDCGRARSARGRRCRRRPPASSGSRARTRRTG